MGLYYFVNTVLAHRASAPVTVQRHGTAKSERWRSRAFKSLLTIQIKENELIIHEAIHGFAF